MTARCAGKQAEMASISPKTFRRLRYGVRGEGDRYGGMRGKYNV